MIADAQSDPAAIELGNFFPQHPEEVWRALTDPDLLARWLFRPIGFVAVVGARFHFASPEEPGQEIHCEVLAVRPFHQLTYTWRYLRTDHPERWTVDWSLTPQGRGTRLLLTQTGFDITNRRQRMLRNAMERGWKRSLLPRLGEVIHH